ncbi:MAG: hypothetical protein CM1200mP28_15660 [Deltaproteobacteria bacterium]|nr:MAG: hypothetical protein CM1200mP28_15660 [Deltaproteobacteria bacterium]
MALLESPSLDHYLGLRDRAMLELLYSSGLKVNELLGLDVEDLFLDLEFLKVRSKRERMVPITTKAVQVLRTYLEEARENRLLNPNDPCLFPGRNGTRMTRVGFWAMIKKHAKGVESAAASTREFCGIHLPCICCRTVLTCLTLRSFSATSAWMQPFSMHI